MAQIMNNLSTFILSSVGFNFNQLLSLFTDWRLKTKGQQWTHSFSLNDFFTHLCHPQLHKLQELLRIYVEKPEDAHPL